MAQGLLLSSVIFLWRIKGSFPKNGNRLYTEKVRDPMIKCLNWNIKSVRGSKLVDCESTVVRRHLLLGS